MIGRGYGLHKNSLASWDYVNCNNYFIDGTISSFSHGTTGCFSRVFCFDSSFFCFLKFCMEENCELQSEKQTGCVKIH